MAELDKVANALNAINRANLSSAVADQEQWRQVVNDYFLFPDEFDDSEDSDSDNNSETEENDGEDVEESSDVEDIPLVITDPVQEWCDKEKALSDNFR